VQLIARWKAGEDPISNEPAYFEWTDGRPATREDFEVHRADTQTYMEVNGLVELLADPAMVGDVGFDACSRRWVLFLPNKPPVPLDLSKPGASDRAISWALADLDVLYRVRIHREKREFRLPRRRWRRPVASVSWWGESWRERRR